MKSFEVIAECAGKTVFQGIVESHNEKIAHSLVYGQCADNGIGVTNITVMGEVEPNNTTSNNAVGLPAHYGHPRSREEVVAAALELVSVAAANVEQRYTEDARGIDDLMGDIDDDQRLNICGYLAALLASDAGSERRNWIASELTGYLRGVAIDQSVKQVKKENNVT